MIQRVLRVGLYLLAGIGALYLVMLGMFFFSRNVCEISVFANFPSPSLDRTVEVEHRSCRGQASVVTAWLTTSQSGYRLELSTSPVPADAVSGGTSPILAVWTGDSHVRLVIPRGSSKIFERGGVGGVTVKYEER
jgi:hypothetical protein